MYILRVVSWIPRHTGSGVPQGAEISHKFVWNRVRINIAKFNFRMVIIHGVFITDLYGPYQLLHVH